jgi:excinuclease UvrABC nuclease subunit
MLFKNTSGEPKKVRKGDAVLYEWVTVKADEEIELPEEVGLAYGLEALETKAVETSVGEKKVETKVKDTSKKKRFESEIQGIKGIGRKTAKDIISTYKSEESLRKAIKSGQNLPFRDDVAQKLIDYYG